METDLEFGSRKNETGQLDAIAPLELDGAGIEEPTRTGIENLESLRTRSSDEASRQYALLLTGEPDRNAFRGMCVAEDDWHRGALPVAAEHDRVDPEDGALRCRPLLPLGKLPSPLAREVVGQRS